RSFDRKAQIKSQNIFFFSQKIVHQPLAFPLILPRLRLSLGEERKHFPFPRTSLHRRFRPLPSIFLPLCHTAASEPPENGNFRWVSAFSSYSSSTPTPSINFMSYPRPFSELE
ncbi:hypothetical protein AABB24_017190, partial [Solanum stoloniferum]